MKKYLFLVCLGALLFSYTAKAQTSDMLMATLQHGDKTTVYYGIDAFVNAYNAAADSADVITLSSGIFNGTTISKSISLYGAGMEKDTINNIEPTVLYSLEIAQRQITKVDDKGDTKTYVGGVNGVHIEGIYFTSSLEIKGYGEKPPVIDKLSITRFRCKRITFNISTTNTIVRHCVLGVLESGLKQENFLATNSYIHNFVFKNNTSTVKADHCIIMDNTVGTWYGTDYDYAGDFTNNILFCTLFEGCTAKNNVFVGQAITGLGAESESNNYVNVLPADIFLNPADAGDYAPYKTFKMIYPELYLGTDNTTIGLYGGNYGWNKIPCTPRITSSSVDLKTTSDGKLKVSITGEAQTKD